MVENTLDVALNEMITENQESPVISSKVDQKNRTKQHLLILEKTASSHLISLTIEVDKILTEQVYTQAINLFRSERLEGFTLFNIPGEYLEMNYKSEIAHRVKQYLFYHFVLDFLLKEISKKKIILVNYPRLLKIELNPQENTRFFFDISVAHNVELKEWRHFSFKTPKRKKYKDLDKQVINFLDQESYATQRRKVDTVEEADWVLFTSTLVNCMTKNVDHAHLEAAFWIKIQFSSMPNPLAQEFLHKKTNDSFYSSSLELDALFSNYDGKIFTFLITIKAIVKGKYFNLDLFKSTFKVKNKIEIHNKLMEVFSYRNDISQRKAIIEELFHLFLTKHRFEIPKHLVLRRQEDLISTLTKQPDYQVYRSQKNFHSYIELLAEKQIKEEIIIDNIMYKENITLDPKEAQAYLHFFNNKKLKEFVYFKPMENIEDQAKPINVYIVHQAATREKTLNFIIHTLTR